jgi:phosphoglycolate phosphatase
MSAHARVRALVFDLDGTLIDSSADIAAACNYALGSYGFPTLDKDRIWSFVGDGARALMARAAALDESEPWVDGLLAAFVDYYERHPAAHTELAPGTHRALADFPHLRLGLCTNKPRRTTDAVLAALDIARRFDAVVAGGDVPAKKPDPAPLLRVAELLDLSPSELVMIGDGPQDIACGRAAGARTVAVAGTPPRGAWTAPEPDARLDSLEALAALLDRLGARPSTSYGPQPRAR